MNKIVIIGKKNVGKSSLFNLITKKTQATIINYHGYTRDCISDEVKIKSKTFNIIDTAGIGHEKTDLDYKTIKKTWECIKEADIIIFIINAEDKSDKININILKIIRKIKKHIIYVINKIDLVAESQINLIKTDLKIETPLLLSIKKNIGISTLLDHIEIISDYKQSIRTDHKNITNIAIIGRQNVGKSTLVNKISKTEKLIIDNTPGTTRDSIKITTDIKNTKYNIIDTPGIKKQTNTLSNIEKISNKNTLDTIKFCDLAIIVTDINNVITTQDQAIQAYVKNNNKNTLIIINKSDTIKKIEIKKISTHLKNTIKNIEYIFVSAKYNFGVENILRSIGNIKSYQKTYITNETIKNTEKILYKEEIKKITLSKYIPLTIHIELINKTKTNNYKKKYIIGTIIKKLKLKNISTKIIFK